MFYCIDLLRKNGKFSVIWLAATKENSLKKRDFMLVDLERTCSDLKDYIVRGGGRPRLSLYLSSQLLFGTIKVYSRKIRYLLGDTLELFAKVKSQPSPVNDVHDITTRKGKKRSIPFGSPKYTIDLAMSDLMMGFDINSSFNLPLMSELPPIDDLWFSTDTSILEDAMANTVPRAEITLMEEANDLPQIEFGDEEFKCDLIFSKDLSNDYLSNLEEPATIRRTRPEPENIPLLKQKTTGARSQVLMNEGIVTVPKLDICLSPLIDGSNLKRKRKKPRALLIDPVIQFSKDDISRNLRNTSPVVRKFITRTCKNFRSAECLMNEPMRTSMVEIPLKRLIRKNMSIHPRLISDTSEATEVLLDAQGPSKKSTVKRKLELPQHMSTPLDKTFGDVSKTSSKLHLQRDACSSKDSSHLLSRSNLSVMGSSSRIQEAQSVPNLAINDSLRESFIAEQLMESMQAQEELSFVPSFENVVNRLLEEYRRVGKKLTFSKVCPTSVSRKDAAKFFTGLIEGIKNRKWNCRQDQPMGDIEIYL